MSNRQKALKKLLHSPRFWFGASTLCAMTIAAIFAPLLAPTMLDDIDIMRRLQPPSSDHWLGFDLDGGDVLTGLLYGARTSLYVATVTVILSVGIGTVLGLISGFKGGLIDTLIMRTVDLLMAFPGILLAMALAAALGPSLNNIILAITATGWTSSARLIRGQVLSLREREYIQAARALGARDRRLIFLHILPQTWSPLIIHATFAMAGVILVEASLSFLGLGVPQGTPTWGALLGQGREVLTDAPHLSIAPGVVIMLVVLALNFLGDALRDSLDPRHT